MRIVLVTWLEPLKRNEQVYFEWTANNRNCKAGNERNSARDQSSIRLGGRITQKRACSSADKPPQGICCLNSQPCFSATYKCPVWRSACLEMNLSTLSPSRNFMALQWIFPQFSGWPRGPSSSRMYCSHRSLEKRNRKQLCLKKPKNLKVLNLIVSIHTFTLQGQKYWATSL